MPISLASFLPPSPLLLPEIGKENYHILDKTSLAYEKIKEALNESTSDLILIFSPSGASNLDKAAINLSPEYFTDFSEFGILSKKENYQVSLALADLIYHKLDPDLGLDLISESKLDYASSVLLSLIDEKAKHKILPIYLSKKQNLEYYQKLGEALADIIKDSKLKVAVIALGSLSSKLNRSSPKGYSPKAAKFDNRIIEYLNDTENGPKKIMKISEDLAIELKANCMRQFKLLFSLLGESSEAEVLAYQNDFGIGYLSLNFKLNIAPI